MVYHIKTHFVNTWSIIFSLFTKKIVFFSLIFKPNNPLKFLNSQNISIPKKISSNIITMNCRIHHARANKRRMMILFFLGQRESRTMILKSRFSYISFPLHFSCTSTSFFNLSIFFLSHNNNLSYF